jgi:cytochrome c-type biogenesis protein
VLGGVLTYVASQEATPIQGAALLSAFALGISLPLLAIAIASDHVLPLLNRLKRLLPKIEYAAGLGLFIFGIYVLSQARLNDFLIRTQPNRIIAAIDYRGKQTRLDQGEPGTSRMVFFYSQHCPVCHAMEKFLPEFERTCSSKDFELIRINVDWAENSDASHHFGVRAVPTISFLNHKGAELVHLVGYQTQGRLREAARTATQVACAKNNSLAPSEIEKALDSLDHQEKNCQVGTAC